MPTGKKSGSVLAAVLGVLAALPVSAQENPGEARDWSHRHLVFSNPGTAEEAIGNGTYDRWLKIAGDPRLKTQQTRRQSARAVAVVPTLDRDIEKPEPVAITPEANLEAPERPLPRGLARAPSVPSSARRFFPPMPRPSRRLHADWSENMGSGASAGLGVSPAKYSFRADNANCGNASTPDFVVYNTGLAGASAVASIVAYDNLYTGCSGTVPSVYWAFNTGGTIVTSVVLSLDGSQVVFAQSSGAGAASLVVLKWKASSTESPSSPGTPTAVAAGAYRGCSAPCMTTLALSGGAGDSGSSPFSDYTAGSDALYIGDDSGKLHKFTGIFQGTPAEAASPWPVSVSASALSSPVYDSVSGRIFVGDYLLNLSSTCAAPGNPCGYLYAINAATGATAGTSARLDDVFGLVDGPLVDSAAGMVYAFVGADGHTGTGSPCGPNLQCSGVFQFPTSFTSGSGTETTLGAGYEFLLAGDFDNAYYTSTPSSPSGHLYVVGNTGAGNNTLYQVSVSSNAMNTTASAGPALSNNYTKGIYAAGLQVAEFYNGSKDYVFVSVLSYGLPTSCNNGLANGCVMGFDVTGGSLSVSATPTAATAEAGGTSGIVIDNAATTPSGASNIYFTTLGDQTCTTSGGIGGCAIQAAQAAP